MFSGDYFNLMRDVRESFFYTSFRMTPENFDRLLAKFKPRIRKQSTRLRQPISAAERLAVTLGEANIALNAYIFSVRLTDFQLLALLSHNTFQQARKSP